MVEKLLAVAGLLFTGGVFGKLIDVFFISKKDKIDTNSKIIGQLQELVLSNITRQNDLQKDVDYWRREYNELHKENQSNQAEKEGLKKQVENFKKQVENLNKQYTDLKQKYEQLIKNQKAE